MNPNSRADPRPPSPQEIIKPLTAAVEEAGALAASMFRKNVRSWNKENASPVSDADLAVDRFLRDRLQAIDPAAGWLSEETADSSARLSQQRVWIVDPIDGTRSFVAGREDWAVCAALAEHGRPVAAALAMPATNEIFVTYLGSGATRNGKSIRAGSKTTLTEISAACPFALNDRLTRCGIATIAPRIHSIAVRLCRVASGEIDAAFTVGNANDWDLAAADLLVHEAGGKLTDSSDRTPVYNLAKPVHDALIASGRELHPSLLSAFAASEN